MRRVEKPWGRTKLWPGFDDPAPGGGEGGVGGAVAGDGTMTITDARFENNKGGRGKVGGVERQLGDGAHGVFPGKLLAPTAMGEDCYTAAAGGLRGCDGHRPLLSGREERD